MQSGSATTAGPVTADRGVVGSAAGSTGPAVVAESDCTIWVPEGWQGEVGAAGAYVLRRVP